MGMPGTEGGEETPSDLSLLWGTETKYRRLFGFDHSSAEAGSYF